MEQTNMQKVTINQQFNVPIDAMYRRESDAVKTFEESDHPKGFYQLTKEEQEKLLSWCTGMKTIKTPNNRHTSYGLKHWFEASEGGFYITNGQFKGAMILSGYSVNDPDELNWTFTVSELSYREKRNACVKLPI